MSARGQAALARRGSLTGPVAIGGTGRVYIESPSGSTYIGDVRHAGIDADSGLDLWAHSRERGVYDSRAAAAGALARLVRDDARRVTP